MRTECILLACLVACGPSAAPPAKPVAPASKCAFVADHLLSLMSTTAKEAPTDELDRVRAQINKACVDEGWSPTAQECLLGVTSQDQIARCDGK